MATDTKYDTAVKAEREALGYKTTLSKLTPAEAGLTGDHPGHQCQSCVRYIKDGKLHGRCFLIAGAIAAAGTCDAFVEGAPKDGADYPLGTPEDPLGSPDYHPVFSRDQLRYRERPDGFFCKNCLHWIPEDTDQDGKPGCRKVASEIPPEHCCNFYADYRSEPW